MMDFFFTCTECGAHDLRVVDEFLRIDHYETTLPCTCPERHEYAVFREHHVVLQCRRSGRLDEGDQMDWEEEEERALIEEEMDDEDVMCIGCVREAHDSDWEVDFVGSTTDADSEEWYVLCGGCAREIEFGWSHPDRAGRIWPAECADFNPWQCWPEPRYVETWAQKGWLRPPRHQR
jgi:hypothetical protein